MKNSPLCRKTHSERPAMRTRLLYRRSTNGSESYESIKSLLLLLYRYYRLSRCLIPLSSMMMIGISAQTFLTDSALGSALPQTIKRHHVLLQAWLCRRSYLLASLHILIQRKLRLPWTSADSVAALACCTMSPRTSSSGEDCTRTDGEDIVLELAISSCCCGTMGTAAVA